QAAADECGPGGECAELADRERAVHRRHAAIGAREEALRRHESECPLDRRRDLFRRLAMLARDIDRAEQDILPAEQPEQLDRHLPAGALDRGLVGSLLMRRSPISISDIILR